MQFLLPFWKTHPYCILQSTNPSQCLLPALPFVALPLLAYPPPPLHPSPSHNNPSAPKPTQPTPRLPLPSPKSPLPNPPLPSPSRSIHLPSQTPLYIHSPLILCADPITNNSKQFSRSRPALSPSLPAQSRQLPQSGARAERASQTSASGAPGLSEAVEPSVLLRHLTSWNLVDRECCQPPSAAYSHSARFPSGHGSDDSGASEGGSALLKELCGAGAWWKCRSGKQVDG